LRAAGLLVAVVSGAVTWAALNATALRATYAARQMASAATAEERERWADSLTAYGEPGARKLAEAVRDGDDAARAAAAAALGKHLANLPDNDPAALLAATAVLDACHAAPADGQRALIKLLPAVLKRTGPAFAPQCRAVVSAGLKAADPETRLAAARLAMHPDIKLRAELVPLLAAVEPEVRGAALFGCAEASDGEPLVGDEDLFRWLHDADPGVRKICRDALVARDRSEGEIALGRRLTHPDPAERLKLLLDLRYDDEVADPEPWLERLSRDAEPAVRAGAARVAAEVAAARNVSSPAWVGRIADADAHPTVRFVAAHYRSRPAAPPVRQVGAP
jgi:hypothetical protein